MWCVADLNEDYIAKMEDVLETYEGPINSQEPVVCLDEKPVTLHADVRPASPAKPGREARRDNEYDRRGTANVFCAVEPKAGRHCTYATPDRSAFEFAKVAFDLALQYPAATSIHLTMDNLAVINLVDKVTSFKMAVNDMPKAKAFYADKLGLEVTTDYRRDDHNWWVSLSLPENGASIVLSTAHENMKPGAMSLYFVSADIAAAYQALSANDAKVNEVKDDLYGPGSGVKWFNLEDSDGNQVFLVQA